MVLRSLWIAPLGSVVTAAIAIFSGDGGRLPPESCVFTQFLNVSAFLFALSCYMRHRMIVEYYAHRLNWSSKGNWRTVSQILLGISYTSAVAVTILANFSVKEQPTIHEFAASFAFWSSLIYAWGQVLVGYLLKPHLCPMKVQHCRTTIIILATIAMILHLLAEKFHILNQNSPALDHENLYPMKFYDQNWPELIEDKSSGQLNHLASSISEWIMVLLFEVFVLSFTYEFRFAYMHAPRVIYHTRIDDRQITVIPDD